MLWPFGISIGELTCFIIQIHLSTLCIRFFHRVLLFLKPYFSLCVCVCFDALRNGSKRTYMQRQYKKKPRHRIKNVIHSFIHSLLVLLSLSSSRKKDDGHLFLLVEKGKIEEEKKRSWHLHFMRVDMHARLHSTIVVFEKRKKEK